MNDGLALMWLTDLLGKLERGPRAEDPAEHNRIQAVRHAIKVIKWRQRLRKRLSFALDMDMEGTDG